MRTYYLLRPWIRWLVPLPIIIWLLKRKFFSAVIYQDAEIEIGMRRIMPQKIKKGRTPILPFNSKKEVRDLARQQN